VIAEGVEDRATLERLRGLGCDVAQGFGIAHPMPPEALPRWVSALGAAARA
jgi:EAL domain-containing protein (putative c-di-GMP-specific phosphodiesterase class I)